jgi:hypothetical protein
MLGHLRFSYIGSVIINSFVNVEMKQNDAKDGDFKGK